MQRYAFYPDPDDRTANMIPDETGDYVGYEDVLPLEKRVKELEAALRPFARFACDDGKPAIGCTCLNCIAARALEAPHEP